MPGGMSIVGKELSQMRGEVRPMKHKSLNQLLCAATVNSRFRETLLRDPAQALAGGYFDHTFSLTPEEQELVMGIRAQRLEDFAAQVYVWISGNGNGNGHGSNGNGHSCNGYGHNGHNHGAVDTIYGHAMWPLREAVPDYAHDPVLVPA